MILSHYQSSVLFLTLVNVEHSRSFRTHESTISEMLCSCAEYEVQYILLRT
jgi:hypothetical protein